MTIVATDQVLHCYVLTEEERVLLNLRTGHSVTTVHRIAYLKLYVMNQKKCCDPHGIHKKRSVTRGLKSYHCVNGPTAEYKWFKASSWEETLHFM